MSRGVSLKESFAAHGWKIETKAGKFDKFLSMEVNKELLSLSSLIHLGGKSI